MPNRFHIGSKPIFVAIRDPVSVRTEMDSGDQFCGGTEEEGSVSRCNSVTETNLLILFAPPREKNLIKRKIPYSPWNYDERGGQGETRGGEEKRVNNFYSEISWRTFLPRLILFDAFFSLFFSFLP